MGTLDYNRLLEVLKPVSQRDPDPATERLEKMRQDSNALQRGWCDNKKDLIKKLAAKFIDTPRTRDIREMKERKKIADQKPKSVQGMPNFLTGNSERHLEVEKGLILTEVLAQRKEHEQVRKEYKDLCRIREEHEQTQREKIEADLIEKQSQRYFFLYFTYRKSQ